MRLGTPECWERLRTAGRGVLCTFNGRGEIDAVPVCFAVVGRRVATPIELVKPKATTALARTANLARDPAATLLCDSWDPGDWSALWWVRARLMWRPAHEVRAQVRGRSEAALRAKYPQYKEATFVDVLVFEVTGMSGWAGAPS